jgi:RHS repeat-associated protein
VHFSSNGRLFRLTKIDTYKRFYVTDYLDSTRFLTNGMSGLTGDKYVYDAYGRTLTHTGTTDNAYQFAGEVFDDITGLQYLRDRYMDPNTGRFTRRDSFPGAERSPISTHPYLYANNNPVTFTDPSGFFSLGDVQASINIRSILDATSNIRQALNFKKWVERAEASSDIIMVSLLFPAVAFDLWLNYESGDRMPRSIFDFDRSFRAATDGPDLSASQKFSKPVGSIRELEFELALGSPGDTVPDGIMRYFSANEDYQKDLEEKVAFKTKLSVTDKSKQEVQFSVRYSPKDGLTLGGAAVQKLMEYNYPRGGYWQGSVASLALVVGFSGTLNSQEAAEKSFGIPSDLTSAARLQMSIDAKFLRVLTYDYPLVSFTMYNNQEGFSYAGPGIGYHQRGSGIYPAGESPK